MNLISIILLCLPCINESIPEGPFLYPGSHTREVILVDPEHSPLLEKAYQDLISQLKPSFSEQEILQTTLLYIRTTLFDLELCTPHHVKNLIQSESQISLEVFLQNKTGVCRHMALTSTYLIHQLIKDKWLVGNALLIRSDTPMGRHAWTLFQSKESAWHLDPLWEILEDGKTSAGFSKLCHIYGRKTMENQKVGWENPP